MSLRGQCLLNAPLFKGLFSSPAQDVRCLQPLQHPTLRRAVFILGLISPPNFFRHCRHIKYFSSGTLHLPASNSVEHGATRDVHWSNAYAENATLKSEPSSRVRSHLREWQLNNGQLQNPSVDFPLPVGDTTGDSFVRPEIPKYFHDDGNDASTLEYLRSEDHPDEDVYNAQFSPGDMVELMSGGNSSILAVLIGILGVQYQFYTINGKLIHVKTTKRFIFSCPHFISAEELESLKPFLPAHEVLDEFMNVFTDVDATVPRTATSPILKRMAEFRETVDEMYRKNSSSLDNAHSIVASPQKLKYLSCQALAKRLLGRTVLEDKTLYWPALHAIIRFVVKRIPGFSVELRIYDQSNMVIVESHASVARFEKVAEWVRAFQEETALGAIGASIPKAVENKAFPLRAFLKKAKALIEISRTKRALIPGCGVGPSRRVIPRNDGLSSIGLDSIKKFSSSDEDIIYFLLLGRLTGYLRHVGYLRSLQSCIVRATGAYSDDTTIKDPDDSQDVWNLLIEIGAVQPWQNSYDPSRGVSPLDRDTNAKVAAFNASVSSGKSVDAAADLRDVFESGRHDWRDMPVYCIDALGTVDIDDGISVESIPGSPAECWLHVHVSHPSAFIERDSFVGRHVMYEIINTYLPDGRRTLLPASMATRFNVVAGGPVLTYSARLSTTGSILESKIRPSIVHNVKYLALGTVQSLLTDDERQENGKLHRIGCQTKKIVPLQQPLQEDFTQVKTDLKFLFDFCIAREKLRTKGRVNEGVSQQPTVKAQTPENGSAITTINKDFAEAEFHAEDPAVLLTVPARNPRYPSSRFENLLVSESMLIAGSVAASFCRDRNIPIVFHGTRKAYYTLDEEVIRSTLAAVKKLGIPGKDLAVLNEFYVRRNLATMPIEHKGLGLDVYTKVTSPMRRGLDMIVGWQIDAALAEEMGYRKGTISKERFSHCLPFTKNDLDAVLPWIHWKLEHTERFQSSQTKHWMTQFMFRAHYFQESTLPSPLIMTAMHPRHQGTYDGPFHELGLNCTLSRDTSEYVGEKPMPEFERGDIWQVAIVRISTFFRKVDVRPVRLLGKSVRTLSPERERYN